MKEQRERKTGGFRKVMAFLRKPLFQKKERERIPKAEQKPAPEVPGISKAREDEVAKRESKNKRVRKWRRRNKIARKSRKVNGGK